MIRTESFAEVAVESEAALWNWLSLHHEQLASVWLVTHMADQPGYVSRDQVLDALVAFGWIDGLRRKRDDGRTMQLISPRKQQIWAETYKRRAARLIDEGRMQNPGVASIAAAKAAGLWDAFAHVDALVVPEDLQAALNEQATAATFFAASAPSYRRNVLRWLATAKTAPTRAKRIAEITAGAARGEKVPQY